MKTKITKNSKIALLALIFFSPILFSSIFFSLVGGNNLQAQEQKSSKTTGWFVGVNPFSPSIELETKHSESYTNFTRITETVSGDIRTRREVTVDSNITSTSAADLRIEYEIENIQFHNNLFTTQYKIDGIEAGRYACREGFSDIGFRFGDGNYFYFQIMIIETLQTRMYTANSLRMLLQSLQLPAPSLWDPPASIIYRILVVVPLATNSLRLRLPM